MRSSTSNRNRRWFGTIAALVAAGAIALATAGAHADPSGKASLAGTWKLDRKASDQPGKRGAGPHDGAKQGGPPPDGDRGKGGRPGRLGPWIRVEQANGTWMVSDTTGALLREIVVGNAPEAKDADDAVVLSGKWKGSTLEVTAVDPRGRTHIETWDVGDGGKTLTIVTRFDARGERPAKEVKRVYRRTSA